MDYSINKFDADKCSYSMTRSVTTVSNSPNDNSAGKQLMYVPVNQANSSVRLIIWNYLFIIGNELYRSKIYTQRMIQMIFFISFLITLLIIQSPVLNYLCIILQSTLV